MRYLFAYLPAAILMGLIFFGSTGVGSSDKTSRIIGPFLRWLFPSISEDAIWLVQLFIRKCAHLTEYALLAGLVWFGRRKVAGSFRTWSWREVGRVILPVVCLYAITDEFHQSFVPGRQGSPIDVMIDTFGGFLGMLAIWAFGRWRKIW